MPGISFTTGADGKVHYLGEKLGTNLKDDKTTFRVVLRNDAFNNSGTSIVASSGPLGVGTGRQISAVLVKPQATAIDSLTVHNARLEDIIWNDYGATCQLSVTWNPEKPSQA
jgi:hypothetical protein